LNEEREDVFRVRWDRDGEQLAVSDWMLHEIALEPPAMGGKKDPLARVGIRIRDKDYVAEKRFQAIMVKLRQKALAEIVSVQLHATWATIRSASS
jgi:hypothetical protein